MGGRNPFLGICYIVVGGICVLLGAIFTVTQLVRPRYVTSRSLFHIFGHTDRPLCSKLGDHSYLSWNTDQPSTATTTGRAPRANE